MKTCLKSIQTATFLSVLLNTQAYGHFYQEPLNIKIMVLRHPFKYLLKTMIDVVFFPLPELK
jgi:hypothetical protein